MLPLPPTGQKPEEPAAPQGGAYENYEAPPLETEADGFICEMAMQHGATLLNDDGSAYGFTQEQLLTFTKANRASRGQAPAGAATSSELVATMLDALKHAQKVLNHYNFSLECAPINSAILTAKAAPQPSPAAQDAARLDWLENDVGCRVFHLGKSWYTRANFGMPYRKQASLRAAIDAARAAQEGK